MTPDIKNLTTNSESDTECHESKISTEANGTRSVRFIGTDYSYKHKIVWQNAIGFLILHLLGLWGFFIEFTGGVALKTFMWVLCLAFIIGQGVTTGAHRLFTHRCFKAKPVLRAVFLALQTAAGQNSMFVWARDHRLHHRYTDTDADPHNSRRGFFFSHIGWLMAKKHPLVIERGRTIDMRDLQADWMVMFQKKYYFYLYFVFAVFLPVWSTMHFFGESLWNSFLTAYAARYIHTLNVTWLVNSAAHLYGTRPYDKNIHPVESWFVSFVTNGEGFHNYHHAFPWDYKAAEFTKLFNLSANLIQFCAMMGWAYDLKTASPEVVRNKIMRTGDGTHYELGNEEARRNVTAVGPLHPLNPTYNVTYDPPGDPLKPVGQAFFHENDAWIVESAVMVDRN